MIFNILTSLLPKKSDGRLLSVDIGTSAIKVMELDTSGERPRLVSAGSAPTPAGAVNNNTVIKPDQVAQVIRSIMEANDIQASRATTSIPGPSVFTKKITIGQSSLKDLATNIAFEAGNYIPHKIDAVHLDYQVLRTNGSSTMDLLLVAVKNEIINSYCDALTMAGLEPAIADVDYFALENMFAINYPEENNKTVALVNVGSRYTSINIIQDGESLFTGDVSVGGRLYTDALCETLGITAKEAEQAKLGQVSDKIDPHLVQETLDRTTEHVASELHRQLGFFWNAAATDRSIEAIYISGGGSQISGLVEELTARTGLQCTAVDVFRKIECGDSFDSEFLAEIAPQMAVSVGLASRRAGDKKHAIN